jgi:hypothetical protein
VNVIGQRIRSDTSSEILASLHGEDRSSGLVIALEIHLDPRLTILGTVCGRPCSSLEPVLVPAPEYPLIPKMVGGFLTSISGRRGAKSICVLVA